MMKASRWSSCGVVCFSGENGHAKDSVSSSSGGSAGDTAAPQASGDDALTNLDDSAPVHYFVMGPQPRWESAPIWPPPNLAQEPLPLFLGSVAGR